MKIAIIGGASAFTPGIIEGLFAEQKVLAGAELCLMDIDEENLKIVALLARRMVEARHAPYTITHTTDRTLALSGAKFVLCQVRVGGLPARAIDEQIPLKHGCIGQETTGPGGFSFAWRSIPFMLDLVRDMEQLCPEAYLINYSNPTGQVARALLESGFCRVVAICDEPSGVQHVLSRLLLSQYKCLEIDNVGVNHCGWITALRKEGKDILPALRRLSSALGIVPGLVGRMARLVKRYGFFPSPYLLYYYFTGEMLSEQMKARKTRAQLVRERLPAIYAHYAEQAESREPYLRLRRGVTGHGDLAVQVIASLHSNRSDRIVVNGRNNGVVKWLPDDAIIEVPGIVHHGGCELISMPDLPEELASLIQQVERAEAINVKAAVGGDRQLAIEAMRLHPLVPEHKTAQLLVADLVEAHRRWLPQF